MYVNLRLDPGDSRPLLARWCLEWCERSVACSETDSSSQNRCKKDEKEKQSYHTRWDHHNPERRGLARALCWAHLRLYQLGVENSLPPRPHRATMQAQARKSLYHRQAHTLRHLDRSQWVGRAAAEHQNW
jgi:hypothetical protein